MPNSTYEPSSTRFNIQGTHPDLTNRSDKHTHRHFPPPTHPQNNRGRVSHKIYSSFITVLCLWLLFSLYYKNNENNDQKFNSSSIIILGSAGGERGRERGGGDTMYCGSRETDGLINIPCSIWYEQLSIEAAYYEKEVASEVQFFAGQLNRSDDGTFAYRIIQDPHFYWLWNWHPSFTCGEQERIGSVADGGKWVCNPKRIAPLEEANDKSKNNINKPCLVYSFGSNNDFSFEEAVHNRVGHHCEIHTFDPTIGLSPSNKPGYVDFHPYGLAAIDIPFRKITTWGAILDMLGHSPSTHPVDILKVDIEGSEWGFLFDALATGSLDNVRQILMEVHNFPPSHGLPDKTVLDLMQLLRSRGFVMFNKEPNGYSRCCIELCFLRLDGGVVRASDTVWTGDVDEALSINLHKYLG